MGDPPLKSPSDQIKLSYVVVSKSFLIKFLGELGTVALTAEPPEIEVGPSPI